jgi:hypothetical protein
MYIHDHTPYLLMKFCSAFVPKNEGKIALNFGDDFEDLEQSWEMQENTLKGREEKSGVKLFFKMKLLVCEIHSIE